MDKIRKDERFASVFSDPRFKKVPLKDKKTKIDKRFQAMFKDKDFKLKYVMDKRGRPMEHTSSEDLKKYYELSSSDSEKDEEENERVTPNKDLTSSSESSDHDAQPDDKNAELSKNLDEAELSGKEDSTGIADEDEEEVEEEEDDDTSSDDESDSSVDELEKGEFDHKWDELDADAPTANSATRRLALCNMDWDRIRAEDILAVFNSFKPADSIIHSVKIYPSEYGLQRMEEEKLHGPRELVEETLDEDENDKTKDGSRYHREKLRQYQINRLKYYYAVLECDTSETADSLYEQLNGMEYESSAVCMDLRFIPDDVTFDEEPKSVASSAPDPQEYRPRLFTNSALQQIRVNLTWDETDPKRREALQKAFREPDNIEKDIKDYLASSSESDSEDEEDGTSNKDESRQIKMKERIANYKSLLQSIEEKEKEGEEKYDMEITWEPDLKEKTEELVKGKIQKGQTPFEEQVQKNKEDKRQKKQEKKKLLQNDESEELMVSENNEELENEILQSGAKHKKFKSRPTETEDDAKMAGELALLMGDPEKREFNKGKLTKKPRKQKKKAALEDEDFKIDVDDSRFSAIYTSHLYNIDPSNPHYKQTKAMEAIIDGKQKKRKVGHSDSMEIQPSVKQSKMSAESRELVNSIKRKAHFKHKK